MRFCFGKLEIEAGGMARRRFRLWIPDGLHIWLGDRGVHLYWAHSPYMPRFNLDSIDAQELPSSPNRNRKD